MHYRRITVGEDVSLLYLTIIIGFDQILPPHSRIDITRLFSEFIGSPH